MSSRCLLLFCPQVKADKDSANLHRLQQASRGVTQATAAVVASTKSGKSQIEETGEKLFKRLVHSDRLIFSMCCVLKMSSKLKGTIRSKIEIHYELLATMSVVPVVNSAAEKKT